MDLFKRKKLFFKTLCLVLLSSLTLNLYSFNLNLFGETSFGPDSIITDNEWEELEVDYIVEKWKKYTKSNFDSWGIEHLLKNAPKGSKEILKFLVDNKQVFKIVDEIVEKFKNAGDALINYQKKHLPKSKKKHSSKNKIASIANYIKANSKIRSGIFTLKTIVAPAIAIFSLVGGFETVLDYTTSKINGDPFGWGKNFIFNFKKIFRDLNPIPGVYKSYKSIPSEKSLSKVQSDENNKNFTLGDRLISCNVLTNAFLLNCNKNVKKNITISNNNWKSKVAYAISVPIALLTTLSTYFYPFIACFSTIKKSISTQRDCSRSYKDLIAIADLFKSINKLKNSSSLPKNSLQINTDNILVIKNINNFLNKIVKTKDGKKLFDLLNSPTFTINNEQSLFYSRGTVLAADYLLKKIYKNLQPLLQNIACLGGYRAIATMIKESQKSNTKFCFVEKINSPTPVIDLKNAWFPLIDTKKAVPNDINLGNKSPHNAVITGPNSGGKTNSMKTIGFNVLLSRLGIAAAETAKISDFSSIATAFTHQEEINLSCFQSEAKNIKIIKNKIKKYHNNKKNILVILDEPYKGTTGLAGEKLVYELGMEIANNYDNCSIIMATHMEKPSTLPENTNGQFKNYQMGYRENDDGTFKKTYKIKDGFAEWWFKDEEKSYKFIKSLMAL